MSVEKLIEVKTCIDQGCIRPEVPVQEIKHRILQDSTVVILKNTFPAEDLLHFRRTVSEWGKQTPPRDSQTYVEENFHAIETGVSPRQKTLHLYHAYNFARILTAPQAIATPLLKIFEPLREFYCRLIQRETRWNECVGRAKFRPQVIHYPRGGGHLATHVHPLEPQLIGFILSISKRGIDFKKGAVGFEALDGSPIDTSEHHDLGDIIMFKFDLKHWVTPVDIDETLNPSDEKGRWVVTLPLN
jgi:hypothetical protein